jgi:peptidyl-prolyl cis-trans isomerase SurA
MIFCKKHLKYSITFAFLLISSVLVSSSYAQDASRKTATATAAAVPASVAAPVDNKIRNIDGVAAVVNTGFITRREIDDRIAALQKQGTKMPDAAEFRKAVLERLIVEKIQLQSAEQEGIRVTNKELEKFSKTPLIQKTPDIVPLASGIWYEAA